jgi:hypothetical protein
MKQGELELGEGMNTKELVKDVLGVTIAVKLIGSLK